MEDKEWEEGPEKILIEGFDAAIRNGLQYLRLRSAGRYYVFAMPPQLSEGIGRSFVEQFAELESKTGQKIPKMERSNDPKAVQYDWKQIKPDQSEDEKK